MSLIYDGSMKTLVSKAVKDWGDAKKNRAGLIPYPGGKDNRLNILLWGIDINNGEIISIIGPEKGRKTTFALNIFHNIAAGPLPVDKPRMAYLTLESGQPPERIRDLFLCMEATRWLIDNKKTRMFYVKNNEGRERRMDILSPEYLRYHDRYPVQQEAIDYALERVATYPINVYGPHRTQGGTRSPDNIDKILKHEASNDCKLICLDHLQQVSVESADNSMKQLYAVVGMFADAVVKYGMAGILISQVSLTSIRGEKEGIDRQRAVGGKRLDEEANVSFSTQMYKTMPDKMLIKMYQSRRAQPFHQEWIINPSSGLFVKEVKPMQREEDISNAGNNGSTISKGYGAREQDQDDDTDPWDSGRQMDGEYEMDEATAERLFP